MGRRVVYHQAHDLFDPWPDITKRKAKAYITNFELPGIYTIPAVSPSNLPARRRTFALWHPSPSAITPFSLILFILKTLVLLYLFIFYIFITFIFLISFVVAVGFLRDINSRTTRTHTSRAHQAWYFCRTSRKRCRLINTKTRHFRRKTDQGSKI